MDIQNIVFCVVSLHSDIACNRYIYSVMAFYWKAHIERERERKNSNEEFTFLAHPPPKQSRKFLLTVFSFSLKGVSIFDPPPSPILTFSQSENPIPPTVATVMVNNHPPLSFNW